MTDQFNLLTVDLEEWYVAEALVDRLDRGEWGDLPSTVVPNSRRLLDLFRRKQARATWFVLGWVAERHPELLREIQSDGHEIACHSFSHRRVDTMQPDEFRADTERAMQAIQAATGERPRGYRAPSWSINASIPWAFQILADLGFEYDSSIFPIKHDIYGMPEGPRELFRMKFDNGRFLYEIPASTWRLLGQNVPIAGGGYLRHCPYWYSRLAIRKLNLLGRPAVVYIHPWEIDPQPPRVTGLSLTQRLRSYGSTAILALKLERLLEDFNFTTMTHYIRHSRRRQIGFY
jgi:polysaccharide deacetylase family protein (PEP-CTERM system associated)